jgi:hypothetical protein
MVFLYVDGAFLATYALFRMASSARKVVPFLFRLARYPTRSVTDALVPDRPPSPAAAFTAALKGRTGAMAPEIADLACERCARLADAWLAFAIGVGLGNRRPESPADAERLIDRMIEANDAAQGASGRWAPAFWRRLLEALDPSRRRRFFYVPVGGRDDWTIDQIVARRERSSSTADMVLSNESISAGLFKPAPWTEIGDFRFLISGGPERIEKVISARICNHHHSEALRARLNAIVTSLFALLSLPPPPASLTQAIEKGEPADLDLADVRIVFKYEVGVFYWTEGEQARMTLELCPTRE